MPERDFRQQREVFIQYLEGVSGPKALGHRSESPHIGKHHGSPGARVVPGGLWFVGVDFEKHSVRQLRGQIAADGCPDPVADRPFTVHDSGGHLAANIRLLHEHFGKRQQTSRTGRTCNRLVGACCQSGPNLRFGKANGKHRHQHCRGRGFQRDEQLHRAGVITVHDEQIRPCNP